MFISSDVNPGVITCGLLAIALSITSVTTDVTDQEAELTRLTLLVEEVLPAVAELTGMPADEPVEVTVKTRAEFRDFLIRTVETEYPDEELYRRGRCLGGFGLLPEDYDLEAGLIDLIGEEAGGLYDPRGKVFCGISDLPPMLKSPMYQDMIVSHELTHALQDRVIDIVAESEVALKNLDYEYAFRAAIEGMATVVMVAYMNQLKLDQLPDTRSFMRGGFEQRSKDPNLKVLYASPKYLREVMISPYAEGGAFVQAWLGANPERKLVSLFERIPASSEQVLHPEKYEEPDDPTDIDLSAVDGVIPESWNPFYTNTLGEFDLLTLFTLHDVTAPDAQDLASGWDGVRFEAYDDEYGRLVIVGSSVWDSEPDAAEFETGFSQILAELRDSDEFEVVHSGEYVDFVIGASADARAGNVILEALRTAR
jgi:hypothetical protein